MGVPIFGLCLSKIWYKVKFLLYRTSISIMSIFAFKKEKKMSIFGNSKYYDSYELKL